MTDKPVMSAPVAVDSAGTWRARSATGRRVRNSSRFISGCIISGILFGLVWSGCTLSELHAPLSPEVAATLRGSVRVEVLSSPDEYLMPREVIVSGIQLVFRHEGPLGTGESSNGAPSPREAGQVSVKTDRRGHLQPGPLPPGDYRLLRVLVPVRERPGGGALKLPALEMPLQSFRLQVEMPEPGTMPLQLMSDGRDKSKNYSFHMDAGQTLFIGELKVFWSVQAFKPENPTDLSQQCIERQVMLPGLDGSVYRFSDPVFARLCYPILPPKNN